MEVPPVPDHLWWYLPGVMDLSPMRPDELWQTDATDFYLGRAVQEAWHKGVTDAKDDHKARQAG